MDNREEKPFYTLRFIWTRMKNGLVLMSLRNLFSRTGIDINPYYWVQEGLGDFEAPSIKGDEREYEFTFLGLEELQDFARVHTRMNIERMIDDFKNGQECIALTNNGEIAAMMFIAYNEVEIMNRVVKLEANEAYLLNMFTFQAYRGKNLAPYLRYKSYELLRKKGFDKLYSVTVYFNKSSRKFKSKLHARNNVLYLYIGLIKKYHRHIKLKQYF